MSSVANVQTASAFRQLGGGCRSPLLAIIAGGGPRWQDFDGDTVAIEVLPGETAGGYPVRSIPRPAKLGSGHRDANIAVLPRFGG